MTPFSYCKKAEILYPTAATPIQAAVSVGSIGGLLVTASREAECPLRTPVDIRFFDPFLGLVRCRCRLSSPLVSGTMRSYRCEVLEQLTQIQRREDIKISLSVVVEVDCGGVRSPATIQNISAGGVYLLSSLAAAVGDRLSFNFTKTTPPILLNAEILRAELQVNQTGRSVYGYGCRFVDMGIHQESLLRSYVFQEERRLFHSDKKAAGSRA